MLDRLVHRGPDGHWIKADHAASFGMARLTIKSLLVAVLVSKNSALEFFKDVVRYRRSGVHAHNAGAGYFSSISL